MALINEHYLKLSNNYLFADIAKKVNAYKATHPKARVISLGIGDVTRPLVPAVIEAMHKAVDEMAVKATFRGYGPERGYEFLREAIIKNDFLPRGIHLDPNEIFINDGAKSDTGNIGDIVRWDNSIGMTDPIYPVYIDSNVMCGRAGVFENGSWSNVNYMPCTAENGFTPQIPDHRVDMIYLCYPNNPTGTVLPKEELRKWVNYALHNDTLILFLLQHPLDALFGLLKLGGKHWSENHHLPIVIAANPLVGNRFETTCLPFILCGHTQSTVCRLEKKDFLCRINAFLFDGKTGFPGIHGHQGHHIVRDGIQITVTLAGSEEQDHQHQTRNNNLFHLFFYIISHFLNSSFSQFQLHHHHGGQGGSFSPQPGFAQ